MDQSRRGFLKATVTAAGGMMIAFTLPSQGKPRPYEKQTIYGSEINAWLVIEPNEEVIIRVAQAEMGQGVFTSLPMIVADELELDFKNVRAEYADANRSIREDGVYKRMLTGGGGAVRRSREYLQQAGAEARERLIKAASEKWRVPLNECYADYGRIIHKPSKKAFFYGEIAADAAKVSVANVKIKTARDFGLIGLPQKRLDVPSKVNGSAQFGMDVRIKGMVYAAVVHCPVIGGQLRNFKFNVIREMPGVQAAVRLDNGVAVVANTYWQARTAVLKLPVEWEIGPAADTYSETIRDEFLQALDGEGIEVNKVGDADAALQTADKIIQSDYTLPYLAHACMEPLNCTVNIQSNRIDVWAGMQNPEAAIQAVAKVTGRKPETVHANNCFLGGGFGRRSNTDYITEATRVAMEVGMPVQMIWSREEDMRGGQYRPMAAIRFKVGMDGTKKVVAYSNHSVTHSILQDAGRSPENGVDSSSVEGLANMPYQFDPKTISHTAKNTHVSSWWWRSVGSSQNAFAMECFIDELATEAGQDPFVFRQQYLQHRPDLLKVLAELKEKSNWSRRLPNGSARGMAIHECFGTIVAQVAEVTLSADGKLRVDRVVTVADCGHLVNPLTAEMQIESGIVYGLSAALYGKISIEKGRVLESNFDTYRVLSLADTPKMETHWLLSGGEKWGGLGEPGLPCVAPAVANAIYKITQRRIRSLPITDYILQPA